jgi:hypothetical protein
MAILDSDIQLLASQVLADVPEGGGAATGIEIQDGVSNNLFDDISELDRVYGDVSLRKVFVAVRTPTVDRYLGAHVIVADPPDDPDVSSVLFSTEDFFDERAEAASRIEAYLAQGPAYQGLLYGNHIAGQMTVMLIQRTNALIPPIGATLCLRKNEGLETELEQYVRVTSVESMVATFTDSSGDFQRLVVTLSISDQLRADFPGFPANRIDTDIDFTNKTRVYDTVVADAARYYGVVPLEEDIELGDFVAQTEGIFTQLVPSSRAETPIADARMNQQSANGLLAAGTAGTLTVTATFTPAQNLFIGGGILPGSLSIERSGITLTDAEGILYQDVTAVGTVDYANGVLSLSSDIWPSAGDFTINLTPAAAPLNVTESVGIPVTQENQRLTWVVSLDPPPAHGSLQVSYRTQGRWYVLQDTGTGAIRGADSSYGAGNVNFDTGTVALTVGALPDVGSSIIMVWVPQVRAVVLSTADVALGSRFAMPIDLPVVIKPGTVSITWDDGGTKTATDSAGALTGDAVGRVYYSNGQIFLSPNELPAVGTVVTVSITESNAVDDEIAAFADGGSTWTTTLATPIRENSVQLAVAASLPVRVYPGVDETKEIIVRVFDDGAGLLKIANASGNLTVGTIDYVTGAVALSKSVGSYQSTQGVWAPQLMFGTAPPKVVYKGESVRTLTLSLLNGPAGAPENPSWAWWAGDMGDAAFVRYASGDASAESYEYPMNTLVLQAKQNLAEKPSNSVSMRMRSA